MKEEKLIEVVENIQISETAKTRIKQNCIQKEQAFIIGKCAKSNQNARRSMHRHAYILTCVIVLLCAATVSAYYLGVFEIFSRWFDFQQISVTEQERALLEQYGQVIDQKVTAVESQGDTREDFPITLLGVYSDSNYIYAMIEAIAQEDMIIGEKRHDSNWFQKPPILLIDGVKGYYEIDYRSDLIEDDKVDNKRTILLQFENADKNNPWSGKNITLELENFQCIPPDIDPYIADYPGQVIQAGIWKYTFRLNPEPPLVACDHEEIQIKISPLSVQIISDEPIFEQYSTITIHFDDSSTKLLTGSKAYWQDEDTSFMSLYKSLTPYDPNKVSSIQIGEKIIDCRQ